MPDLGPRGGRTKLGLAAKAEPGEEDALAAAVVAGAVVGGYEGKSGGAGWGAGAGQRIGSVGWMFARKDARAFARGCVNQWSGRSPCFPLPSRPRRRAGPNQTAVHPLPLTREAGRRATRASKLSSRGHRHFDTLDDRPSRPSHADMDGTRRPYRPPQVELRLSPLDCCHGILLPL